jgi:non-heme chloroperoxidase
VTDFEVYRLYVAIGAGERMTRFAEALLVLFFLSGIAYAQEPAPWHDPSSHTVQFVTVDRDVELEVLDWGGLGRPVVLLAGLGNTAHVFDDFAPKLTGQNHVYGITRRGSGASSAPSSGYDADRLGDDVLAVIDALKLDRPVLIGHSIAGEELSSVGTRHPERVSALIYLDAAYSYAYYDPTHGDFAIDRKDLQKKLEQISPAMAPQDLEALFKELSQHDLPGFERDVKVQEEILLAAPKHPKSPSTPSASDRASLGAFQLWQTRTQGVTYPEGELHFTMEVMLDGSVARAHQSVASQAISAGVQKYEAVRVPTLAIYAIPHNPGPSADTSAAARAESDLIEATIFRPAARAFETGVKSSHVVLLPNASHYVFLSNEKEVLREIQAFLGNLH